jgi:threonine dehydratase
VGRDVAAPSLEQVREARERIRGGAIETPLVRHEIFRTDLHLKLENLQPIGSFKLRGALNAIRSLPAEALRDGVYTASAGNMAQGVAWAARQAGIRSVAVVPSTAPRAKIDAITALRGGIEAVPPAEWWKAMVDHGYRGLQGRFIHPFADTLVMAGNGTIALEILEAAPDIDTFYVPWGGGGLACGIAAAARAINPAIRVYACEVEGAAPLAAALAAGRPVTIQNTRSFVDGIGGPGVFEEMWPLARELITDALVMDVDLVAECVRQIAARTRTIAEGAGAVAIAAAIAHARADSSASRAACIVSGGNIDPAVLAKVLDDTSE